MPWATGEKHTTPVKIMRRSIPALRLRIKSLNVPVRKIRLHLPELRLPGGQVAGALPGVRRLELHGGGSGGPGAPGRAVSCRRAEPPSPWCTFKSPPEIRRLSGIGEFDRTLGGAWWPGFRGAAGRRPGHRQIHPDPPGPGPPLPGELHRLISPGRSPRSSSSSGPTAWG